MQIGNTKMTFSWCFPHSFYLVKQTLLSKILLQTPPVQELYQNSILAVLRIRMILTESDFQNAQIRIRTQINFRASVLWKFGGVNVL
jgi:hypothetical protein